MGIPGLERVGSDIWVSLGKLGSNNGVIATDDGTVLVDVPHKPTDAVALGEMLVSRPPVRWIVHTDHHIDHTLTNGFFAGTVVAHQRTYERLLHDRPTPEFVDELLSVIDPDGKRIFREHPERLPAVTFTDQVTLHVGGVTISVMALPGHTPNTVGIYLPDLGVVFTGDTVSGMGLPSSQESSFRAWRASIDTVLSLEFDTLVPGHGGIGDRQTAVRFRDQLDELVNRVEDARDAGIAIDVAAEEIRFEDLIHVTTAAYVGYPAAMTEEFQRRSIRSIYRELDCAANDPRTSALWAHQNNTTRQDGSI